MITRWVTIICRIATRGARRTLRNYPPSLLSILPLLAAPLSVVVSLHELSRLRSKVGFGGFDGINVRKHGLNTGPGVKHGALGGVIHNENCVVIRLHFTTLIICWGGASPSPDPTPSF